MTRSKIVRCDLTASRSQTYTNTEVNKVANFLLIVLDVFLDFLTPWPDNVHSSPRNIW